MARKKKTETAIKRIWAIAKEYGMAYNITINIEHVAVDNPADRTVHYVPGRKTVHIDIDA